MKDIQTTHSQSAHHSLKWGEPLTEIQFIPARSEEEDLEILEEQEQEGPVMQSEDENVSTEHAQPYCPSNQEKLQVALIEVEDLSSMNNQPSQPLDTMEAAAILQNMLPLFCSLNIPFPVAMYTSQPLPSVSRTFSQETQNTGTGPSNSHKLAYETSQVSTQTILKPQSLSLPTKQYQDASIQAPSPLTASTSPSLVIPTATLFTPSPFVPAEHLHTPGWQSLNATSDVQESHIPDALATDPAEFDTLNEIARTVEDSFVDSEDDDEDVEMEDGELHAEEPPVSDSEESEMGDRRNDQHTSNAAAHNHRNHRNNERVDHKSLGIPAQQDYITELRQPLENRGPAPGQTAGYTPGTARASRRKDTPPSRNGASTKVFPVARKKRGRGAGPISPGTRTAPSPTAGRRNGGRVRSRSTSVGAVNILGAVAPTPNSFRGDVVRRKSKKAAMRRLLKPTDTPVRPYACPAADAAVLPHTVLQPSIQNGTNDATCQETAVRQPVSSDAQTLRPLTITVVNEWCQVLERLHCHSRTPGCVKNMSQYTKELRTVVQQIQRYENHPSFTVDVLKETKLMRILKKFQHCNDGSGPGIPSLRDTVIGICKRIRARLRAVGVPDGEVSEW